MQDGRQPGSVPRRGKWLLPLIGAVQVLVVAAVAAFFVPGFVEMFRGFGAELPQATRLLVDTYRWWPLLSLIVPLVWVLSPRHLRALLALVTGVLLALALSLFGIWACYMPLIRLVRPI